MGKRQESHTTVFFTVVTDFISKNEASFFMTGLINILKSIVLINKKNPLPRGGWQRLRVLLDTNILIHREDDREIQEDIQQLMGVLSRLKADILIHPASKIDIDNDQIEERKKKMLSKLGAYQHLEKSPEPRGDSSFFQKLYGQIKVDRIEPDDLIIYSVYKNAVDLLITEDLGIHRKAKRLGISERIMTLTEFLVFAQGLLPYERIIAPPAIREEAVHNLDVSDPIFTELIEDYPEFRDWFVKISREGRKCWISRKESGELGALLIWKIEDGIIDTQPPLPKKRRLKISTFKVVQKGKKIGELFIRMSVDLAIRNSVEEVFLTHFIRDSNDSLAQLLLEFGFIDVGKNGRGEDVFVKRLVLDPSTASSLSPWEIDETYFPSFYDGDKVAKYIVPIRPEYHDRLFMTHAGRQTQIEEYSGQFIVEGNTIKKAYLSNSPITGIDKGGVVLFYRSRDASLITDLGIVESAYRFEPNQAGNILGIVAKRTVYSYDEIVEMSKKPTLVIIFRNHFHLPRPIPLKDLIDLGIIKGAPQTVMQVSEDGYNEIRKRGGIDERYSIH
jgi:hypothetical protein